MLISETKTNRGFSLNNFHDDYGYECSLQKSSSAEKDAVWLGVDNPEPKIMCSDARKLGLPVIGNIGWQDYLIPKEVLLHTRMHLTQEHAKELIKALSKFVETGEL